MAPHQVVLITGCSSGIGRALCQTFHQQGYQVVATARRVEALADLAAQGMIALPLDVTDAAAINACVKAVLNQSGRIDILVNNAGYGQFGPLMDVAPSALKRQFDTNVVAPLALVQAVAPVMKAQGWGVIANVGSISGLVTTPFAGAYCASKAAFHAISDALRLELQPFGIRVVTLQPGAITSNFGRSAEATLADWHSSESWYAALKDQIKNRAGLSQEQGMAAEAFATRVVATLTQPMPPARLRLGPKSTWLPLLRQWLPTRLFETLLSRKFGLSSAALKGSHNR